MPARSLLVAKQGRAPPGMSLPLSDLGYAILGVQGLSVPCEAAVQQVTPSRFSRLGSGQADSNTRNRPALTIELGLPCRQNLMSTSLECQLLKTLSGMRLCLGISISRLSIDCKGIERSSSSALTETPNAVIYRLWFLTALRLLPTRRLPVKVLCKWTTDDGGPPQHDGVRLPRSKLLVAVQICLTQPGSSGLVSATSKIIHPATNHNNNHSIPPLIAIKQYAASVCTTSNVLLFDWCSISVAASRPICFASLVYIRPGKLSS